jgi:hypothetical protein
MTEAQRDLLLKARASLAAARRLKNAGFPAFCTAIAPQPSEDTRVNASRVNASLESLKTQSNAHGSLIFIEVFKIYKLLNLLKLEKLFFVGSPIVTTLGGSWAVITAVYMVLFGLNFGQNRPFFALQKSNFGFAFENERTVRSNSHSHRNRRHPCVRCTPLSRPK